jgi:hypothetical protein
MNRDTQKRLRHVDQDLIAYMRETVHGLSDESLNHQFQISYNTWRKLIQGAPIRASLADRLENRVKQLAEREQEDA